MVHIQNKAEGTQVTNGTTNENIRLNSPSHLNSKVTEGTDALNAESISPLDTPPANLIEPIIERPSYQTHNDWFQIGLSIFKPGLYYHGLDNKESQNTIDIFICSPIHAEALTCDEQSAGWGLLLRFINPNGQWREWAMPKYMLKGYGEEVRGVLLDLGANIAPEGNKHLHRWLSTCNPKKRIVAATRTGWHDVQGKLAFVLPNKVIGSENIYFQSENAVHDEFTQNGTLEDWKNNIAKYCQGNPILINAISVAFTAPLLKLAKLQEFGGSGVHLAGDSSKGKTTALQVATSVWGAPTMIKTWRATANGMEATAATRNDTFLPLDESGECDPHEMGAIVYALGNGVGKQRANKSGGARQSARWRNMVLSSGESSISTNISESGKIPKAGQQARLLDLPATDYRYGIFNNLHGFEDGRTFADHLKGETSKYYGNAALKFIESLINNNLDLPAQYAAMCKLPDFATTDSLEARAAGIFALIALAGELATQFGLTGWDEGEATSAAILAFHSWRDSRGHGKTEDNQILQSIKEFILKHGDSRFSEYGFENANIKDRAGWWQNSNQGRIYMFSRSALREAAPGFDQRKISDTLETAKWITTHDNKKRSKKHTINGTKVDLYMICPRDD